VRQRPFQQVDVFSPVPLRGNPVAVVVDGAGLTAEEMQQFSNWTNLSETTFVVPPTSPAADYAVRIFTPDIELPFAGHPTLGSCHAWLESGGQPRRADEIVQECAAGLVRVRRTADELAFAAPPTVRSGDVDAGDVAALVEILGLSRDDLVAAQWVDNGPGWVAVLLRDATAVLAVEPGDLRGFFIGVAGPAPAGSDHAFEVRAFFTKGATTAEDPVTGSLNASLAQWFLRTGVATAPFRTRQGTALGRAGVVSIDEASDGVVWVGGATTTVVTGIVTL
jgi:PhzF family phenazine biosynthesis protein